MYHNYPPTAADKQYGYTGHPTIDMQFLANIKIAKKLALVLGGNVLLLTALSGLAVWGLQRIETCDGEVRDATRNALLAEKVSGSAASIGRIAARMILLHRDRDEDRVKVVALEKDCLAALQEYRQRADNPQSTKQAAEMEAGVQAWISLRARIFDEMKAARFADAGNLYGDNADPIFKQLRATATEAVEAQEQNVGVSERNRSMASTSIWWSLMFGCLLSIGGSALSVIALTRNIASPMAVAVTRLAQVAGGDLEHDVPELLQGRKDEIGLLAQAMQHMIVNLRKMVQEISSGITVLSKAATELLTSSSQMTTGSRHASDKAHSVAAAAEEMSANVTSVAVGMEQTTANLSQVASATEQMTSTIGEIAGNSEKARRITGEASRQSARITEQIQQLGQAARDIGKVTETIAEISSQTNLLALNATLEAARAGSAGKGFAVVANEIKALAQQTAAATEDIKQRIGGVQSATAGGVAEIAKISRVIEEVSEIVNSIAAAIEEQATATQGIAQNIAQASSGVTDANARVAESSQVSREIAKDITSVDRSAGEMTAGSDRVRTSATELSTVAEQLRTTIRRFSAGGVHQ